MTKVKSVQGLIALHVCETVALMCCFILWYYTEQVVNTLYPSIHVLKYMYLFNSCVMP